MSWRDERKAGTRAIAGRYFTMLPYEMSGMRALTLLVLALAALLEVGGDALVRLGLRNGRPMGFLLGAISLFVYGLTVNSPRWDFGRLLGVYVAVFFVVTQLISVLFFRERLTPPTLIGGLLIIAGGLVITFWRTG